MNTRLRYRVLHVITGLGVGGAETALAGLAGELSRNGIDSVVLSLTQPGVMREPLTDAGIPVFHAGLARGRISLAGLRRVCKVIQDVRPDLVHGWMYHGNLAAAIAIAVCRRSDRPPMIWGIRHSLYDLRDERPLTRTVIRIGAIMAGSAKAVVYNAELSRDQHSAIGYRAAVSEVIPNGFDVQRFRRDPAARLDIRSRLMLSTDAIVVCCVARFHPLKNHDGLMAAFAQAYSSDPRLRLLLVGPGMEAQNPAVSEMARRHGILSAVLFAGETSDVVPWLSAADCFCLASSSEAFPNALGEAMACELPCVATDVGEVAAVLGDCGRVVPRKDTAALGHALLQVASLPPGERARLGRQGRERVARHYSLEQIGRRYLDLYGRVLAGGRN